MPFSSFSQAIACKTWKRNKLADRAAEIAREALAIDMEIEQLKRTSKSHA